MLLPELPEGNAVAAAPRPLLALVCISASKPCTQAGKGGRQRRATTTMDRAKKGGEAQSSGGRAELDLAIELDVVSQAMALAWRGWARGRLAPRHHDRQL